MRPAIVPVLVLAAAVAGCTYPAVVAPSAAPAVPSGSTGGPAGPRVPGTFQLDVGQANLRPQLTLHGIACRLANFPVDAASAFERTVRESVAQVVERVEPASGAPAGGPRPARGGTISVLPSSLGVDVDADQELLGVSFSGRATLTANVTAEGPGGTVTFAVEGTGTGSGRNALIGDCDTIATVGGQAIQAALADFAANLRRQLAAAPQLRAAARR